jgi:hypothetical protein
LTIAGLDKLTTEMAGKRTPEGEAEAAMKKSAIDYAKRHLSFEDDTGFLKDPKGMDALNLQFIPAFYKAYGEGRAAGKTSYQLLSKDSPDFIVDKVMAPFKRSQADLVHDRLVAGDDTAKTAPDINTRDGLKAAVLAGHMTRAQGVAEAMKRGYIRANPGPLPEVPLVQ